ncbi:MAG: energy transducer TonB [Thermoanaerobaculia bacterium]
MKAFAVAALAVLTLSATPSDKQQIIDRWQSSMQKSSDLLMSGNYQESLKITNSLIDDMVNRLGPGDSATQLFGGVLVQKALAHAGLGQEKDAIWYWHLAVNLYKPLATTDLSGYGRPGLFLRDHPFVDARQDPNDVPGADPRDRMVPREMTPVKLVKKVAPSAPPVANEYGVSGRLTIEATVDENGGVFAVRVLRGLPMPTLTYLALEALKQWRFKPATEIGKPVKSLFTTVISYE